MSHIPSTLVIWLMLAVPALALSGNAPPASGFAARSIVMVVDPHGDLCTGTALASDLVLTAAHCVVAKLGYEVETFQTGRKISVRAIALHSRFDLTSYAASRATADVALLKLSAPLYDLVRPAKLAPATGLADAKVGAELSILNSLLPIPEDWEKAVEPNWSVMQNSSHMSPPELFLL